MVGEVQALLDICFAFLEISSMPFRIFRMEFLEEAALQGCLAMFCDICETCIAMSASWQAEVPQLLGTPNGATRCHTVPHCAVLSGEPNTFDRGSLPVDFSQKRYNKKAIAWQRLTTFLQCAVPRMRPNIGVHSLALYRQPNPKETSC